VWGFLRPACFVRNWPLLAYPLDQRHIRYPPEGQNSPRALRAARPAQFSSRWREFASAWAEWWLPQLFLQRADGPGPALVRLAGHRGKASHRGCNRHRSAIRRLLFLPWPELLHVLSRDIVCSI